MDRALFFACKNDRESFCGKVESGKGRVYQCLMDNMNVSFCKCVLKLTVLVLRAFGMYLLQDDGMSEKCRDELVRWRGIEAQDYRANYAFAQACRTEISDNGCEVRTGEGELTARSRVLLCLEDVTRNEEAKISQKCRIQLDKERQRVMSDASTSPELLVSDPHLTII